MNKVNATPREVNWILAGIVAAVTNFMTDVMRAYNPDLKIPNDKKINRR
jgi:4-amino-4-deoxy-L-arabinose transferase-like glycosyltransferase